MKRVLITAIFVLMMIAASLAQTVNNPTKKIAPELLKQDFAVLKDSLQKLHAGLYRYKSNAEMNKVFDHCFARIEHPMNEIEYFNVISYLISSIDDGHTECFLSTEAINYLKENAKWFPVEPLLIGKKAYVKCDAKEFPAGTELLSIDNKPIDEIREQLFQHLPSDGSNQTGKYVKMTTGHDPFFYLYYVVFGEKPAFEVAYKTSAGNKETITLNATNIKNLECPPAPVKITKYLQLDYKHDDIAVMTISTFANDYLAKTNENLATFLAASFKELSAKKTSKLIIDLRENGGGDDTNGSLLYSYLTDKPFSYYASLESNTRKIKDHPNLAIQQPKQNNFKGKVYFLISGKSFSGAAEFASVAQSNARGPFIGEETGGGYYGNTSGSKVAIVLPNTRIRVNIPLNKYVMAVKKAKYKDRGIIPDHIIVPTINDILQNKDVQMDYTLQLAEKPH